MKDHTFLKFVAMLQAGPQATDQVYGDLEDYAPPVERLSTKHTGPKDAKTAARRAANKRARKARKGKR